MDATMKLARGKYKDGLKALYEADKRKVYFLCQWLLTDSFSRDEVFIDVFKDVFSRLDQVTIETEQDFTKFICLETIKKCKLKEFEGNPHVFKNYALKNVDYRSDEIKASARSYDNTVEELERCLNTIETPLKFILISSWLSQNPMSEISRVLGIDEMKGDSLIQEAYNALKVESVPMNEYASLLQQGMNTCEIPSSTEEKVNSYMNQNGKNQPNKSKLPMIVIAILVVVGCVFGFILGSNKKAETQGKIYEAVIEVENYGNIEMELRGDIAPVTVENFVKLANEGFYDGLTFHRIIDGFMIQGGDPEHNGTGGSDENIQGEFKSNGFENELSHVRGTVSMARSRTYNSASSQFFICHQDSTFLDGEYAAFGTVTSGMDVVDAIVKDAHPTDNNGTIPFEEQPVIKTITITEK